MSETGFMGRRDVLRGLALMGVACAAGATDLGRLASGAFARGTAQQPQELLIRGGRVVNADGVITADVRVVGEEGPR